MNTKISEPDKSCSCLVVPHENLTLSKELGMVERYADVSLMVCPQCGRHWLLYHYELEAFTQSGRWYLGIISAEQASLMTAADAKSSLEELSWYFYGGSYFGGRSGRSSGTIY